MVFDKNVYIFIHRLRFLRSFFDCGFLLGVNAEKHVQCLIIKLDLLFFFDAKSQYFFYMLHVTMLIYQADGPLSKIVEKLYRAHKKNYQDQITKINQGFVNYLIKH